MNKQIEAVFKEHLEKQYYQGLSIGAISVAEVTRGYLSKLSDDSNFEEYKDVVNKVRVFCDTTLKIKAE
jgi:hypothetical protein